MLEREPNITVVADASDPATLVRIVDRCQPQVLLLEDRFSAVTALEDLPATVILASDLEAERLISLLCGVVRSIVHRSGQLDDLVKAIHAAAAGQEQCLKPVDDLGRAYLPRDSR